MRWHIEWWQWFPLIVSFVVITVSCHFALYSQKKKNIRKLLFHYRMDEKCSYDEVRHLEKELWKKDFIEIEFLVFLWRQRTQSTD